MRLPITFCLTLILAAGCRKDRHMGSLTEGYDVYITGQSGDEYGFWKNGHFKGLGKHAYANGITVDRGDVYIPGEIEDENHMVIPGYWKNDQWTPLTDSFSGAANEVFVSGNDVYAVGSVLTVPGPVYACCEEGSAAQSYPVYWKNAEIHYLEPRAIGFADKGLISEGSLYIAGRYGLLSDSPCIWKDNIRMDINPSEINIVSGIGILESDLYVTGLNRLAGGSVFYKNQSAVRSTKDNYTSINVAGPDLYITAYTDQGKAFYLKNDSVVQLYEGISPAVFDLCLAGTDVYVAGCIYYNDYRQAPVYWKNGHMVKLANFGYITGIVSRPLP